MFDHSKVIFDHYTILKGNLNRLVYVLIMLNAIQIQHPKLHACNFDLRFVQRGYAIFLADSMQVGTN